MSRFRTALRMRLGPWRPVKDDEWHWRYEARYGKKKWRLIHGLWTWLDRPSRRS